MNLDYILKSLNNLSWLWLPVVNIFLVLVLAYAFNRIKNKIFNKLLEQKLTKITALDLFCYATNRPLTVFIWLIATTVIIKIAATYLEQPLVNEWLENTVKVGIVLLLAWAGNRFVHRAEGEILQYRWKNIRIDKTSTLAIGKLCRIIIYLSGTLIILPTVGIPISGVLALGGVGGIAVGFAAKEMIANLLGGIMLYVERPFSVNDSIELPEKNITGKISNIGWRTTKIKMLDHRIMYVPNSVFATTNVINETKRSHFRVYETIALRYEDIRVLPTIMSALKIMLEQHPDVEKNEIIHVGLTELSESALHCLLWCYINKTNKPEYLQVLEDILLQAHQIVANNGAAMAYPTSIVIQRNLN